VFLREICFLRELDHPNIVKVLEIILTDDILYLVFELVDTDLKDVMANHRELLTPPNIRSISQ
jgi:serine/threonine protein kinase